ncbi:MAG TPA: DUF2804 domain-containing protein [Spirochaetota bacterium]|nr:DUF2804 domain-containing protein [Spirochaetota bacterium]HPU89165.1 DUF2804 domain-containing protein [Spirochaetota bacterium]
MKHDRNTAPYRREVLPPPESLVTNGRFNLGTFNGPIANVNPLDARRPLGVPLPRALAGFRLKEWEALQLGNEQCFMLVVLYDLKLASLVQFIYYDRREGNKHLYETIVPSWRVRVPSSLRDTVARYRSRRFSIEIHNDLARGLVTVSVSASSFKRLPDVRGRFECLHAINIEPIVVCQPFAENRAMYSHKCLMPMRGALTLGGREIAFDPASSFAILDDHKGFYPYALRYDWVTGAGFDSRKRLVGFNLTDNQVRDPERYNENCLWISGRMHPLPPIRITRPDGDMGRWSVRDAFGMVDIGFTPVVDGVIDMNLGAVKIDYHGPFGEYDGCIVDANGKKVSVETFFGMGERKYLRA